MKNIGKCLKYIKIKKKLKYIYIYIYKYKERADELCESEHEDACVSHIDKQVMHHAKKR